MDFAVKHFGPALMTVALMTVALMTVALMTVATPTDGTHETPDETPTGNRVDLTGHLGPMESYTEPPRQSDPDSRKRRAERKRQRQGRKGGRQ